MKSRGLTHIQLTVSDLARSVHFYRSVLGLTTKFEGDEDVAFLTTPGTCDVVTLSASGDRARAGDLGGVAHFGFHVEDLVDLQQVLEQAAKAGGRIIRQGTRTTPDCLEESWAFIADPDGYTVEVYSPTARVASTSD